MLGIFARTFSRSDLAATLDAVRAAGLTAMQFNMALAGGPSPPDAIPARSPPGCGRRPRAAAS